MSLAQEPRSGDIALTDLQRENITYIGITAHSVEIRFADTSYIRVQANEITHGLRVSEVAIYNPEVTT